MLVTVHSQLIHQALAGQVSSRALDAILSANLAQDKLSGQLGHDEFHFDNNAISGSLAYIEQQGKLILSAIECLDISSAWAAFGRLTHTVQDFYSHTNYVDLWLARYPESTDHSPAAIDPVDPELLESPDLLSGKLYYPFEALYFIPALRRFALSILPRDSHAHMNLDSEEQGWRFEYAYEAALKRTRLEFEQVGTLLSPQRFSLFCDLETR
jgi:hypothetical protein